VELKEPLKQSADVKASLYPRMPKQIVRPKSSTWLSETINAD